VRMLVLPRYTRKGPSSRLRHYQFQDHLVAAGFEVDIEPLLPDAYVDGLYLGNRWSRWRTVIAGLRRLWVTLRAFRYDVVWIEKEIFPFAPALAERLLATFGVPIIVDYDDAWQLRYKNHPSSLVRWLLRCKIETVMRYATLVVVGNPNLMMVARAAGSRKIAEVPTVIDLERYRGAVHRHKRPARIVWIGSSLNSHYLYEIAEPLRDVCRNGRAELVVVGGRHIDLPGVPVRFVPWSEQDEAAILAAADIGIMPLADTDWERGKCGFKALQYMAAGLPVVASPVGISNRIVSPETGFLAANSPQWSSALNRLIDDSELRERMGRAGRAKVEREFTLANWGPSLATILVETVKHPGADEQPELLPWR
jgi:glycosyltransferase involved in cell wall biosynthesis